MNSDMAIGALWAAGPTTDAAERNRRRRVFAAARRHSRLVKRLRVLLPVGGTFVVLLIVAITQISLPAGLDLSLARLSVTRNSVIMDDPHLTGFDADGREYSVQADRAVQALANPDRVALETIAATIKTATQGSATIKAAGGDFDNAESTLDLFGGIAVDSSEGYSLRLQDADIDLEAGTLVSGNPVSITYEDSETSGSRLEVTEGGQRIVIEGSVRTRLMPPKRAGAANPDAAAEEELP